MTRSRQEGFDRRTLLKGSLAVAAASTLGQWEVNAAAAQEGGGELVYAQSMPITTPDPVIPGRL